VGGVVKGAVSMQDASGWMFSNELRQSMPDVGCLHVVARAKCAIWLNEEMRGRNAEERHVSNGSGSISGSRRLRSCLYQRETKRSKGKKKPRSFRVVI
jgi:hypothetical protein